MERNLRVAAIHVDLAAQPWLMVGAQIFVTEADLNRRGNGRGPVSWMSAAQGQL
jgi:hypothetical protein